LSICQDEFLEAAKSVCLKRHYTAQPLALDTSVISTVLWVQLNWLNWLEWVHFNFSVSILVIWL